MSENNSYEVYFTKGQLQIVRDTIPELRVVASVDLAGVKNGDYRLWLSADLLMECCKQTGQILPHYHCPIAQKLRR